MSLSATTWAWEQCLKASQKIVLLSLADRADKKYQCFPSIARLSKDTCLDRKTVILALKELENTKLIKVKKSIGSANYYHLNTHETSTKNGTSTKTTTSTKNGTQPVPKTGLDPSQKRDTNLSLTYQEPKKKSKPKEKWFIPEWVNVQAWNEFEEFRTKHKKSGWSDLARTKAVNLLKGFTHEEQQQAIDKSILGGYSGLFPKKLNGYDNEANKRATPKRSNCTNLLVSYKERIQAAE